MKFLKNKGKMYGNMEKMYKFSDLAKQGDLYISSKWLP